MKSLEQHLINYGAYHRDPRNIYTHFVGIPLIVFGVATLLATLTFSFFEFTTSWAIVVISISVIYYFLLDFFYGISMLVFMALAGFIADFIGNYGVEIQLISGVSLFIVGWIFQFVGHYYEGKKPAFVDDIMGLVIGPLFVVAELSFMLKLRSSLESKIVNAIGPVTKQT